MVDEASPGAARLARAIPNVFITDMPRTLAYFTGPLGFTALFTWGTPPFYAHVRRDDAVLALRCLVRPALDHSLAEDVLSAFIDVTGGAATIVDALCRSMQSAGAVMHQLPRDEPWGMRSFIVRDPDGNLICFAANL